MAVTFIIPPVPVVWDTDTRYPIQAYTRGITTGIDLRDTAILPPGRTPSLAVPYTLQFQRGNWGGSGALAQYDTRHGGYGILFSATAVGVPSGRAWGMPVDVGQTLDAANVVGPVPPEDRMRWLRVWLSASASVMDRDDSGVFLMSDPAAAGSGAALSNQLPGGGGTPRTIAAVSGFDVGGGVTGWRYRSYDTAGANTESVDLGSVGQDWHVIDLLMRGATAGANGRLRVKLDGNQLIDREFGTDLEFPSAYPGGSRGISWIINAATPGGGPTNEIIWRWRYRAGAFDESGAPLLQ